jgi:hypothetical protein
MIASSAHTNGHTTPAAILCVIHGNVGAKKLRFGQGRRLRRFPMMCDQQRGKLTVTPSLPGWSPTSAGRGGNITGASFYFATRRLESAVPI